MRRWWRIVRGWNINMVRESRGEKMKRLNSVETEKIQLEVIECDCGFHIGLDATYLIQVGDFIIECPACGMQIYTKEVLPEDETGTPVESRYGGQLAALSTQYGRELDKVKPECETCNGTGEKFIGIIGRTDPTHIPCPDCQKVKPLAQFIDEWDLAHPDERNTREYFQQALDAYQSVENVTIKIERI